MRCKEVFVVSTSIIDKALQQCFTDSAKIEEYLGKCSTGKCIRGADGRIR